MKDHDSESESDKGYNSPSNKPVKFLNVVDSLHIGIERNEELYVSESEDKEQDSYDLNSLSSPEQVNYESEEEKKEESVQASEVKVVVEAAEEVKFDDIDD